MSQLIHLRQRIKAVTTIKKITSAMRLISRSFHTRMYRDMKSLNEYTKHIHTLFYKLYDTCELSHISVPFLKKEEETTHSGKILFILVGSQKGLCGNYNTTITHWIDKNKALLQERDVHVFTLSKKIDEYLKKNHITAKKTFPELKLSTIDEITRQLFIIIKNNDMRYSQISIVANQPKTLEETIEGAINRARNAFIDCNYSIGLESGLIKIPNTKSGYMDITMCAIYDGKVFHLGGSSVFEYPKSMIDLVFSKGHDISSAANAIGISDNPKLGSAEGVIGILTKGYLDRKAYTKQAVITALIHLLNPEHY